MAVKLTTYPFKQEGTQMYSTVIRVGDLLKYVGVDVWKADDGQETGYQRDPEAARTSRVAKYLQTDPSPLMPTSVLLSYRGILEQNPPDFESTEILIPDGTTLWVVDGQHRIYGFKRAIEELDLKRLNEYPLPVVIVENPSLEDEANQFRVINENMKKVRTDLARRILAMRLAGLGRSGRNEIRQSGRLWEAVAVDVLGSLNRDEDSPWRGRIQTPNTRKQPQHVIRELSFSTSLKPILTARPYRTWSSDRISNMVKAYWQAWESLVPSAFSEPGEYVLLKTAGVFSLHQVAVQVMDILREEGVNDPTDGDFRNILQDLGEYATEYFWGAQNSDGAALAGGMKAFGILADAMIEELQGAGHSVN